ncbi:MAG: hypothetical protein R3F60_07650 [bacterium]
MTDPISGLEAELEAARREFERYFLGLEKRLPARTRDEIARRIRQFEPGRDAVVRFRYLNLMQRHNVLEQYWARTLRQIEEGTYIRDIRRADFREARREEPAEPVEPARQEVAARKAAEVGDAAADFLASLGAPMRGAPRAAPAAPLRGAPVSRDPPSSPSRAPAIAMRGQAVRDTSQGPPSRSPASGAPVSRAPVSRAPVSAPGSAPVSAPPLVARPSPGRRSRRHRLRPAPRPRRPGPVPGLRWRRCPGRPAACPLPRPAAPPAPSAPPPLPMRGAPKGDAPPLPPMRGQPVARPRRDE